MAEPASRPVHAPTRETEAIPDVVSRSEHTWAIVGKISVIVGVIGVIATFGWREMDHRNELISTTVEAAVGKATKSLEEKINDLRDRMVVVEAAIKYLDEYKNSLKSKLTVEAKKPQAQFVQSLPALENTLREARKVGVQVDLPLLKTISMKLYGANNRSAGYWPALAQFISYRSESQAPLQAEKIRYSKEQLPRCIETTPTPADRRVTGPKEFQIRDNIFWHCRVRLDDPQETEFFNQMLLKDFVTGITFKDCLIEYHGGDIKFLLFKNKDPKLPPISSLYFDNCIFDFSMTKDPPAEAQKALKILLLNTSGELNIPPGTQVTITPKN